MLIDQAKRFLVLFAAVLVLLVGHGLQLTLLPLRAEALGFSVGAIGITGSAYFLGFLVGCILVPKFVSGVGHIRVFSTTTTVCGTALLLILVSDEPGVWALLRFFTGVGISGCYIVIESWLNEQTEDRFRGRVLAIYTMLVLLAMSLGQLLVNVGPPLSVTPIVLGSVLLSLAVVPLSLTRVHQPNLPHSLEFRFREIFRASPAAVGAALTVGMVTGSLYTLTPVAGLKLGFAPAETTYLMVAMVIGGAAFQFPVGRLSDVVDRRRVLAGIALFGSACGLAVLVDASYFTVLAIIVLLGGAANCVYPLCLAHANDRYPGHFLQVGTVILMVNSIGAVIGPSLSAVFMSLFEQTGFFVFASVGLFATLGWVTYCILARGETPEHAAPFVNAPKSSPVLYDMDPRIDADPLDEDQTVTPSATPSEPGSAPPDR